MKSPNWTRRQVLKGAGVTLALPWLETFAPRTARAQAAWAKKRYVALYMPNGTAEYWKPQGSGAGASWQLSPLLQPLAALKSKLTVFSNIANSAPYGGNVYTTDKGISAHPSCCASAWTAAAPSPLTSETCGISIDQVVGNLIAASPQKTYLHSLQMGLATIDSKPDAHPALSRSISWASATQPNYKVVNPQAVWDSLVSGRPMSPGAAPDPAAQRRIALRKSTLDYVIDGAATLQMRLSRSDQARVDQFLTSARSLEQRVLAVTSTMPVMGCPAMPARAAAPISDNATPAGYDRGAHADVMISLAALAIQCDITRVVSFMLDDAHSDFVYDFLKVRKFSAAGSIDVAGAPPVGQYHALQHASRDNNIDDGFATIGWWNSTKAAQLASLLDATSEGASGTVLDNTAITFLSGMHGGNHYNNNLPVALIGGGGLGLKQDVLVPGATELQLGDVHFTVLQKVFGYTGKSFGTGNKIVPDILA